MKKTILIVLCALFITACGSRAELRHEHPEAELLTRALYDNNFHLIPVQTHGILQPLYTFARYKLYTITGKERISGLDPVYTILSMMYQSEQWKEERLFALKKPLREYFYQTDSPSSHTVALNDIMGIVHSGSAPASPKNRKAQRLFHGLAERIRAFRSLSEEFRIIPGHGMTEETYISPFSQRHSGNATSAVMEFNWCMTLGFERGDPEMFAKARQKIDTIVPPEDSRSSRIALGYFLTKWRPLGYAFWCYLTAFLCVVVFLSGIGRSWITFSRIATGIGIGLHTASIILRYIISGREPLSNTYEVLVFAAWGAVVLGLILEVTQRKGYYLLGASLSGMVLLFAINLLPPSAERIMPLRAILSSVWLKYHVASVMISYSAFMLSFLFSLLYVLKSTILTYEKGRMPDFRSLDAMILRTIQIGWPLLTIGIVTGAIWADVAWGRFWGWDPKETWALITWIIYTMWLHLRMHEGWQGRRSALFAIIGFIAVLMTWFGVSYLPFLQGLHTYA